MNPYELSPEEEQQIAAETLRSQQVLGAAAQRGSRFDNLAAISPLANNSAIASAAAAAQQRAIASSKPTQLGNSGFMVDGNFAANPNALEDKLQSRAQQRGIAADRMTASAEAQRARLSSAEEQARLNRELRRDLAAQAGALRMSLAASRGAARKSSDSEEDSGKVLPFGAIKDMTGKENVRDAYVELAKGFKKEYGGTPGIAGAENLGGRFFPKLTGKGDQANWWQNYQEQANRVRNQLFGSALTSTEKAAFDAQSIVPGMDGTEIARRLSQQAFIADKAYSKIVNASKASGYNTSGFNPNMVAAPALKPGQPIAPAQLNAPKDVDPEDWKLMTPAEQSRWRGGK